MRYQFTDLWKKLQSWEFTPAGYNYSFARKLALENGWTLGYAERVLAEYRKFLYLTQTAGVMVCPSDEVDQAWHLHLTQTQDYARFCKEVLGSFLHHHASKGGEDELDRHRAMYRSTLELYAATFCEAPNPGIWPSVEMRFIGTGGYPRGTATVVPRRPWNSSLGFWIAMAVLIAGIGQAQGMHNLWRMFSAGEFLVLLLLALVAGMGLSRLLAHRPTRDMKSDELDVYEIAYLSGGEDRVMGTALTRLVELGAVRLIAERDSAGKEITAALVEKLVGVEPEPHWHYFETYLFGALGQGRVHLRSIPAGMGGLVADLQRRLRNSGHLMPLAHVNRSTARDVMFLGTLLCIGTSRLLYASLADKPVFFIVAGLVFLYFYIAHILVKDGEVSVLGRGVLHSYAQSHGDLKTPALRSPRTAHAISLLATGFALFGSQAVMAHPEFAGINFVFQDASKNSTGNSSGVSGCSAGCGGGCGGCGGCGG